MTAETPASPPGPQPAAPENDDQLADTGFEVRDVLRAGRMAQKRSNSGVCRGIQRREAALRAAVDEAEVVRLWIAELGCWPTARNPQPWDELLGRGRAIVTAFVEGLRNPGLPGRVEIAGLLGCFRDPRVLEPLIACMQAPRHTCAPAPHRRSANSATREPSCRSCRPRLDGMTG